MTVVKIPVRGLDQDSPETEIKPGFFREIWGAYPRDGFSKTSLENVPGTTVLTNASLPSGTSTCIGAFSDKANNRIVYFLHNSDNNHSIWYFNPTDDSHTLILQTQYLNFSLSYTISSCSFIEDILQWTDNNNEPRSIIVSRAVTGTFYGFSSQAEFEKQCSLYKVPPLFPPTIPSTNNGRSVGTSGTNNITSDSYQFATRYVYYDNSVSAMSPLSVLSKADTYPKTTETRNKITVTQAVDDDLKDVVKRIQWIYQKNNEGIFYMFRESDGTGATSYSVDFYNNDSTEVVDPSLVSFIPQRSKNIMIHGQRSVVTMDQYDYDDWTTGNLSAVTTAVSGFLGEGIVHAPNSAYSIGIVFYDKFGRTNGVVDTIDVTMPNIKKSLGTFGITSSDKLHIQWSVTGTPPTWAHSFSIVEKRCNTYNLFWKGAAFVMFYRFDGTLEEGDTTRAIDNGQVFWDTAQTGYTRAVYLKLPENLPFTVDSTFKVRILNTLTGASSEVYDIVAIRGDKIIIGDNMGISNWAGVLGGATGPYGMLNIALESYKTEPEELFYEIGQNYDCSDGTFSVTTGRIKGDHHYVESGKFLFTPLDKGNLRYGGTIADNFEKGKGFVFELPTITPSPTFSTVTLEDTKTSVEKNKGAKAQNTVKTGLKVLGALGVIAAPFTGGASLAITAAAGAATIAGGLIQDRDERRVIETSTLKLAYTADLNKSASDFGRPSIIVRNKQVNYEPSTLSISDKYVLSSNINNINQFSNLYPLPPNRTPVRKLVDISASGVFLAIHERSTTSLSTYAGDNIINTSDGSQVVGSGRGVIAYDRELSGGFGTIYPSSVIEHEGNAFWFDAYSGEVIKYSRAGLTPLASTYNMSSFFAEKGAQFSDPTGRNIIMGYDQAYSILYITFQSTNSDEEVTAIFLDWGSESRWYSFFEFVPDRYASINGRLFSYHEGEMWEHYTNETRNLFYDVQGDTELTHFFNTEPSKDKMVRSIGIESNKKWSAPSITINKLNGSVQETRIYESNLVRKDDHYYVELRRDLNTHPPLIPAGKTALLAGQPMIGKTWLFNWKNTSTDRMTLDYLNFGYQESSGHRTR